MSHIRPCDNHSLHDSILGPIAGLGGRCRGDSEKTNPILPDWRSYRRMHRGKMRQTNPILPNWQSMSLRASVAVPTNEPNIAARMLPTAEANEAIWAPGRICRFCQETGSRAIVRVDAPNEANVRMKRMRRSHGFWRLYQSAGWMRRVDWRARHLQKTTSSRPWDAAEDGLPRTRDGVVAADVVGLWRRVGGCLTIRPRDDSVRIPHPDERSRPPWSSPRRFRPLARRPKTTNADLADTI
jgi:hypothetical protein